MYRLGAVSWHNTEEGSHGRNFDTCLWEKYSSVFRACFVVSRWPRAVELMAVSLSTSLVLAFPLPSPGPACFGSSSALVPQRYTSQINILYDGNIVWVCDKACQHRNEQAGTECTVSSLPLVPALSFCPAATTLNQFVNIPNEQQRFWDLKSINKWTSKQTSTRPTQL